MEVSHLNFQFQIILFLIRFIAFGIGFYLPKEGNYRNGTEFHFALEIRVIYY